MSEGTESSWGRGDVATKVLLVDPSRFACLAMAKLFAREDNLALRHTTELAEASAIADDYFPTVVLCALAPGDEQALATIAALRAHAATREVPIVALVEFDEAGLRDRAVRAGASSCLGKELAPSELVAAVRRQSREFLHSLGRAIPRRLIERETSVPLRVLLVDDSRTLCLAYGRMLATYDVVFAACSRPTEALATAREFAPTVILLDLEMPEISGLDLLPRFRADASLQDVPIMVLSGVADPEVKARAFRLGADDYAEKQMHEVELVSRIKYHCRAYYNATRLHHTIGELFETQKRVEIQRDLIRKAFGRYLSDEIVETILETPAGLELGGEKREVSIMMADLRGFTYIAEQLEPEDVLAIINNFLAEMTKILLRHNGTIDEFIGDAILAVFGAPVPRFDDARRAVACAIEMQLAMGEVNRWNLARGLPEVGMGIGIHTGEVVVGNIGSERRTKYGVVGRNVNLTSRIEGCTIAGQVKVSKSTVAACGDGLRIDSFTEIMAKGIAAPIEIFDIGGIGGDYDLSLPDTGVPGLREAPRPLSVEFWLLTGKRAEEAMHRGTLTAIDGEMAELSTAVALERFTDLKLRLLDYDGGEVTSELYAKVMQRSEETGGYYRIGLTSVPGAVVAFLDGLDS